MSFNDKVVVITGAGQGIGEGYAKRCATEGMKVVVAELNSEQGERVVAEIREQGGEAMFVRTDVGDEESCIACANAAKEAFGQIDYLINNAAIFGNMKIEGYMNVDMDYLETFMRVNVHGSLLMARACVPHMPKGSAIVNQSSTAAWMNMGFYGVAKLALNGLTCSLAREENEAIIESFLKDFPEFTLTPVPHPATGAETNGMMRTWPFDGDCDGMFVALMTKKA